MNEGIAPFLNLSEKDMDANEKIILKIDDFLLQYGMKYSGVFNMYVPERFSERDDIVFDAAKALQNCDWLQGILAHVRIVDETNTCHMQDVVTSNMSDPKREKFEYYENYYKQSGKLAHGILVDEDNFIQDGYISFLLAQKYNTPVDIMRVAAGKPINKIVCGRHVVRKDDGFTIKSDKSYIWKYCMKDPVVPGDVLQVKALKGKAFMCVDRVDYITGDKFCSQHRRAVKHMHCHM